MGHLTKGARGGIIDSLSRTHEWDCGAILAVCVDFLIYFGKTFPL